MGRHNHQPSTPVRGWSLRPSCSLSAMTAARGGVSLLARSINSTPTPPRPAKDARGR